jgi:pseudouridine-5'-phosphate glycosidase
LGDSAHITCRVSSPAVALESAVLTRGLPEDARLHAAERMAAAVAALDVAPAFTGVFAGRPTVGLTSDELETLANHDGKLSTRDLPSAVARGEHGGTTVAATVFLARGAGLSVAATGGIGGVHPASNTPDVSADLYELARTPVVLVCSGAKAIVDLPATLERLETLGVTVLGYQTKELPAFYSAESGLSISLSAEGPEEVAEIWRSCRALDSPGALLVCVPPPARVALSRRENEVAVSRALSDLEMAGISGPEVTPFLLKRIAEITEGRSLQANLGLLENNASVAASIARLVG